MSSPSRYIGLALVVATTSCGGKSASDSDGGGGTVASAGSSSGGATSSGGAAGARTATGGGGGDVGSADRSCAEASDCQLVNDCCNCLAINANATTPYCEPTPCFAASCDVHPSGRVDEGDLRCIEGQCAIATNCVATEVLCDQVEPQCEDGMVVSYTRDCYGPCVPLEHCRAVQCVDVTCNRAGPTCLDGFVPEVDPLTSCWTDRCVDERLCPQTPTPI